MDCEAFRHLEFWLPSEDAPSAGQTKPAWLTSLVDVFGLPEQSQSYQPTYSAEVHTYTLRLIEIPLPITPRHSLIWQADKEAVGAEQSLLLRETGKPDTQLGWIDCHGMPYCLRVEEAFQLSAAIGRHADWRNSPAPFLLLKPFIGVTSPVEAKAIAQGAAAALHKLGVASTDSVRYAGPAPQTTTDAAWGVEVEQFQCGEHVLKIMAQTGSSWTCDAQGDWEFNADMAWESLGRLHDYPWPIPCHSIRTRDPFKNFPEASAFAAGNREQAPPSEDAQARFPFESMRELIAQTTV